MKVYLQSKVSNVDVNNSTITVDEGEGAGTHKFDLIIGADGAGSIVRKCMEEQIPDFEVSRFTGHHVIKNLYFDNKEAVKKYLNPHYGYGRDIFGYLTIFCCLKSENNEAAIGITHVKNKKTKTIAETRKFFDGIDPIMNEMMSDKGVEDFMNQEPRNIHKSVRCNRYYNKDNIVLVGDSCHPFRPIGQGINLALINAKELVQQIENHPHDIGHALLRYNEQA